MLTKLCYSLLAFMLLGIYNTDAQNYASAIGTYGGITQDGGSAALSYNYYVNRNSFVQGSVYISFQNDTFNDIDIPYNDFTLNVGYFTPVFKNNFNNFRINAGGGPVLGYEAINNGSIELSNGALIEDKSKFIYGIHAALEAEYTLGDSDFSVFARYTQFYHINSDLGNFVAAFGIGARYFIF